VVAFTIGNLTNNPTAYSWSASSPTITFASPTLENTNATFSQPGTYTITLVMTNASGNYTTNYSITIFPNPIPDFSATPSSGCFPLPVQFTDKTSAGGFGATITGEIWDPGTGQIYTSAPSVTYLNQGTPTASLIVTNSYGCQSDTPKNIITVTPGVTAVFSPSQTNTCKPPTLVNFINGSTGPGQVNCTWNFGDGSPPVTIPGITNPSHIYTAANTYQVVLVAASTAGCTATDTQKVQIIAGPTQSDFTPPGNVCVGEPAAFFNTSTPPPGLSSWKYGDGNSNTGLNGYHVYAAPGTYTVTLINSYGTCSDSITHQVTIVGPPAANFTAAGPTTSCRAPLTVQFMAQSPGAAGWTWDFGDGTPPVSGVANPVHTYSTYGYFDVKLSASSAGACTTVMIKKQFVQVVQPAIHVTNLPDYGCAPVVFKPIYVDTVVDGPASFNWNFGNNNVDLTPNPPAQTYGPGVWTVTVTITTAGGCTATTSGIVKVGTKKPIPGFYAVPTTVCRSTPVHFIDSSKGNPNQWLWKFGDGGTSQSQDTFYTYNTSGIYTVTLIVFNDGCQDSLVKKNYIVVNPPTARFNYQFGCSNNNVLFKDSSIAANTWLWDFGDGSTYTGNPANPAPAGGHNYAAPGTYNVKLIVTNAASGCTDSIIQTVAFYAKFQLKALENPVCKNSALQFVTLNTNHVVSYNFFPGDGSSSGNSSQSYYSHPYALTGKYVAKLVATLDNGCVATDSVPIQVNGPTAGFSVNNSVSCAPFTAQFTDSSKTDGVNPINNYSWNFGDATPIVSGSNQNSVQHPYNTQGMYSISLKVTDASGCSDSLTKVSYVILSIINTKFSNPDSTCPGAPVQFTDSTTGGFNPVYNWTFSNGQTSTKFIPPPQIFNTKGIDTARLIVTDPAYGCADTLIHKIVVDLPVASFTLSDSSTNCPPLIENFTFTGSYYHSLIWNFDAVTLAQNILNPQHIYTIPNTYYPTVTVISPGGCVAKATDTVTVYGPQLNTFRYNPNHGCDTLTVNFSVSTSKDIIKYIWNFGDNTSVTNDSPFVTHFYVAPSDYQSLYLPSVTLTNDSGCTVTYDHLGDTIFVIDIKASFATSRLVGCSGYPLGFHDATKTNGRITNYFWDFGDGQMLNSTNPDTSHVYVNPGNYRVREVITTQFGCSAADTLWVKVVQNPEVDISGGTSQCVPAALQFNGIVLVPDTSQLYWSWNFYNGKPPTPGKTPPIQIYSTPGNDSVQLIVTNSSGCTDTATSNFTIYPLPPIFIGNDTTICLGDSLLLNPTGAVSYTWLGPGNSSLSCTTCPNPVARPTLTTTYIAQGTSINGCQANDSIVVTVNQPVHVTVVPSDSVCLGQSTTLSASGAAIYAWSPANSLSNAAVANPLATPNITTNYQVIGSDNKFCFHDTQYVNVKVFDYPTINAGPDVTLLVGSSYQINGSGSPDIVSINWLPVTGLSCTNCMSPLASPQNTTTYVVSAVNNGGCKTSDTLKITVICNNNNIFVPNTFSPNGDGVNDIFYVRGKGLNTIPSITIFNRWGQIVFQKKDFAPNDPAAGWDGTINGKPAPIDVYIYTIDIICDNSQLVPYHGNVALIR